LPCAQKGRFFGRQEINPSDQDDFKRIKVLGQGFEKKMINEEILSEFF